MTGSLWKSAPRTRFLFKNCQKLISRNFRKETNPLEVLRSRSLLEELFPDTSGEEVRAQTHSKRQCIYAGFDPTASSLHVGNLLVLNGLLHWQRCGHAVIVLIGSATAQVGDPSDRFTDRTVLREDAIRKNADNIKKNIQTIFQNHEECIWAKTKNNFELIPVKFVNNEDWYKNYNCIDFLNKVCRTFRMGTMLLRKSVEKRLNSDGGMCFREFGYQILQAYDWYHLMENHNCKFQIGGNDQMGNIVAGRNFIDRFCRQSVYGMTLPLITTDDGDKFGKSAGNAIWLDPKLTSPYDLYQYFYKTPDSKVELFLKFFSFLEKVEIENIMERHKDQLDKRIAQIKLAEEVTLLVHGEKGLERARTASNFMFKNDIESLRMLKVEDMSKVLADAPIVDMKLKSDYTVKNLVLDAGCFPNEVDATQVSGTGALLINMKKAKNLDVIISESTHVLPNKTTIVGVGKKKCWIIRWN